MPAGWVVTIAFWVTKCIFAGKACLKENRNGSVQAHCVGGQSHVWGLVLEQMIGKWLWLALVELHFADYSISKTQFIFHSFFFLKNQHLFGTHYVPAMVLRALHSWHHLTPTNPANGAAFVPLFGPGRWGHSLRITRLVRGRAGASAQCWSNNRPVWHFKVTGRTFIFQYSCKLSLVHEAGC